MREVCDGDDGPSGSDSLSSACGLLWRMLHAPRSEITSHYKMNEPRRVIIASPPAQYCEYSAEPAKCYEWMKTHLPTHYARIVDSGELYD